ncbi:Clp1/GlmU family protein [Thermococcus sp.]
MRAVNKAGYTEDVPRDRIELVERLAALQGGTVMFIGDVDSGKTTAVKFVARALWELGRSVAVVDSDIGQKSLLPPATVSLALVDGSSGSVESKPLAHYFIGTTTPSQYLAEMVVGVGRLWELGSKVADYVLIDTTGYVRGTGAELKRLKMELIKPDIVAIVGDDNGLAALAARFSDVAILERSPKAKRHSPGERREIRKAKWREYFSPSRYVEMDIREMKVTGTGLFSGRVLTKEEAELISRLCDWAVLMGWENAGLYTVVKAGEDRKPCNRSVIRAVDFETLSNLLVGFIDKEGLCLGLGILKWPRLSEGKLEILTPLSEDELSKVEEIRFGRIRVTEEGEELGLIRREEL